MTKAHALLAAYQRLRPLAAAERAALPALCRGAALRFLLTRLYDWMMTPPGAMVTRKDPLEYLRKLRFFAAAERGPPPLALREPPLVEIWTDGGCKPNPGPAAGRRS